MKSPVQPGVALVQEVAWKSLPPRWAYKGRQIGIAATIRPHLTVIPSGARNLKSITARPDRQRRSCSLVNADPLSRSRERACPVLDTGMGVKFAEARHIWRLRKSLPHMGTTVRAPRRPLELTTNQTGTAPEAPNPKTRSRIGPKTPCTQDSFHRTL